MRVLFYRLLRSQPVGDTVIDGQIRRFSSPTHRRYLLTRSERVSADTLTAAVTKKIRLYVLGPSIQPDGVSEPFDTGLIDFATSFEPLDVRDFDEDSLPDFAYCGWHLDGREVGPVAVGFRNDAWYVIEKPSAQLGECLRYEP